MKLPEKLHSHKTKTPLGDLVAIGSENALHFLGFEDQLSTKRWLFVSGQQFGGNISLKTPLMSQVEKQLASYFEGNLHRFDIPCQPLKSTAFQRQIWETLREIPYGEQWSYSKQAAVIGRPQAVRATGSANGANPFIIITPCHRVVREDGTLGGYGAGLERKKWLLDHELKHKSLVCPIPLN